MHFILKRWGPLIQSNLDMCSAKGLGPLQDSLQVLLGMPRIPLKVATPLGALLAQRDQRLQLGLQGQMPGRWKKSKVSLDGSHFLFSGVTASCFFLVASNL